jgi:D-amino-acid dehydrogenase
VSDTSEAPGAPDAVVIVGGGIVGLSTAIELARRGRAVVVVEQSDIGAGAAIGSAGYIVPSHVIPLAAPRMMHTLRRELGRRHRALGIAWTASPSFWAWVISFLRHCNAETAETGTPALVALGNMSADLTRDLAKTADIMYVADGLLDVYGSESAFHDARDHADELSTHGVAMRILDRHEIRAFEPTVNDSVIGAIQFPDDASVRPASLLAVLHDQAKDAGVTLMPNCEVLGLDRDGDRVTSVTTTRGRLPAAHVVIAAGAWSSRFGDHLGERVPVVAARGLSLTVDRPSTSPRRAMLLGEQHVAIAPNRDELRISGWFELGKTSLAPRPRRIATLEALARTRLDFDTDLTNRRPWAGLRPVTPDGVPIIGPARRSSNVTIATGHAMVGLTMGLGTGRIVAQLITGEPTDIDVSRFAPERFT